MAEDHAASFSKLAASQLARLFSVIYPGVTRGRTFMLYYTCLVSPGLAAHNRLTQSSLCGYGFDLKMSEQLRCGRLGEVEMSAAPKVIAKELAGSSARTMSMEDGTLLSLLH
jgi:hypothetical protein